MQLTINETTIIFNVQYSKRKKIIMEISPEGHVLIKAPTKTSEEDIYNFVRSNSKQLIALQKRLEQRRYISREKT